MASLLRTISVGLRNGLANSNGKFRRQKQIYLLFLKLYCILFHVPIVFFFFLFSRQQEYNDSPHVH